MKKALILSGINWNDTKQRHHYVACELLSKGYEVDFVESIPSSTFTFRKFSLYFIKLLSSIVNDENRNINNNIPQWLNLHNYFILPSGYLVLDLFNRFIYSFFISKRIESNYDIVINYLPVNICELILTNIDYNILIYDCVRNFDGWGGYSKKINLNENRLIKKSNYVFCDSYYLKNKIERNYNCVAVQKLPQLGFEINDRCQLTVKHCNKIFNLVYFGSISSHVDVEILYRLSKYYKICFFGKVENVDCNLNFIENMGYESNVEVLINKIISIGDAIIIPYKGNMDGVIPAKLIQSLYTGLPVFVSSFYDSEQLNDILYVYSNFDDLVKKISGYNWRDYEIHRMPLVREFINRSIKDKLFFDFL